MVAGECCPPLPGLRRLRLAAGMSSQSQTRSPALRARPAVPATLAAVEARFRCLSSPWCPVGVPAAALPTSLPAATPTERSAEPCQVTQDQGWHPGPLHHLTVPLTHHSQLQLKPPLSPHMGL